MLTILDWLIGHKFQSLTQRESDWLFVFDGNVSLRVACLWRLIEAGHICLTSEDHGQQFGVPVPVDVVAEVNRRLADASIRSIRLQPGLLDLELYLTSGHVMQVIPNSSGYEAWELSDRKSNFIAGGGGDLTEITGGGGD